MICYELPNFFLTAKWPHVEMAMAICLDGGICANILNFFSLTITLSTWILALAMLFVFKTSLGVNCEDMYI